MLYLRLREGNNTSTAKKTKKEEKGAWKKDTLNVCESFAFMPLMHNDKMESRQRGALRDDTKNGYEAESILNNTFIYFALLQ